MKLKVAVLTLAVAMLAIAPSALARGKPAKTTLTFDNVTQLPTTFNYSGAITSPKKACKDDRKVTVYQKVSGPDTKIGSNRSVEVSPGDFRWGVNDDRDLGHTYYAETKATDACKGARSDNFVVQGR